MYFALSFVAFAAVTGAAFYLVKRSKGSSSVPASVAPAKASAPAPKSPTP